MHNEPLQAVNILLVRGRRKVADFGLVRAEAGSVVNLSYLTGSDLGVLGTIGWAAPENHDNEDPNYGKVEHNDYYRPVMRKGAF